MFYPSPTSYVNFPLIVAYVKEIVQRKTVQGGGHEFGLTIDEISEEIRYIFSMQFGTCPISILDISNALNQIDETGFPIFQYFTNFEGKTLWKVTRQVVEKEPQKYYFEPIRPDPKAQQNSNSEEHSLSTSQSFISKQKEKAAPSASIDFALMLKDEEELEEEVLKLKKQKSLLEKKNTSLRAIHRYLQNPQLLDEAIQQIDIDNNNLSEANGQLNYYARNALTEIDAVLGL